MPTSPQTRRCALRLMSSLLIGLVTLAGFVMAAQQWTAQTWELGPYPTQMDAANDFYFDGGKIEFLGGTAQLKVADSFTYTENGAPGIAGGFSGTATNLTWLADHLEAGLAPKPIANTAAGLVGLYHFSEGAGTLTKDDLCTVTGCSNSVGQPGILSASGMSLGAMGLQGGALACNGGTVQATTPITQVGDFSLEVWFFPTASGLAQDLLWIGNRTNTNSATNLADGYGIVLNADNTLSFAYYSNSSLNSLRSQPATYYAQTALRSLGTLPFKPSQWNYVALTRATGGPVVAYLNGVGGITLGAIDTAGGCPASGCLIPPLASENLWMGGTPVAPFTGTLDEVAVFNSARASKDILQHTAAGGTYASSAFNGSGSLWKSLAFQTPLAGQQELFSTTPGVVGLYHLNAQTSGVISDDIYLSPYRATTGTANNVTFTTLPHPAGSVTLRVYGVSGTDDNGIYTDYTVSYQ